MALNQETRDKGYLLGRLFAVYEWIQSAALGKNVNATVKDKYYGSASMQPQKVFGFLARNSVNHLARIRKEKPGYNIILDKTITEIIELLDPNNQPFPPSLSAKEQAIFSLGYYHQRSEFFKKQSEKSDIQEKK